MFKRSLCAKCEIGRQTYVFDEHSPMCPYSYCHNGKKCSMYKKLRKPKKSRKVKKNLNLTIDKVKEV